MRILLAHTFYKQPGGEDRVFEAESALLREHGHEVTHYRAHNAELDGAPVAAAMKTMWNRGAHSQLAQQLRRDRPDLVHFHNTFPLMSPAVFYAARSAGVPVVATLHNYRLLCPAATFLRAGRVCEDCAHGLPWRAAAHACYRSSRAASAVTALMLGTHRLLGTWTRAVDLYIALSEFARRKFVEGGLPAERVVVKPNFVAADPGPAEKREDFALFAGRLSAEKGIATLLEAWRCLEIPMRLKIAGDGPMSHAVIQASRSDPRIEWLGPLPADGVTKWMKRAYILVLPSVWYEGLPLTLVEAFAAGLPAIASDIGSLAELVSPGKTGLRFQPGDAADLASRVTWCWNHRGPVGEMGRNARSQFESAYTPAENYRRLMEVYRLAAMSHTQLTAPGKSAQPARNCISGSRI
jgi:glycosyltransferase involved in cell wall biosynthesis